MPKKISEVFGVSDEALQKEGAFNGFIDIDSKFYVDPHLLETTNIPELKNSYQRFKTHFEQVIHLLKTVKQPGDRFFRETQKLLIFPELPFVSLGYSVGSTSGSGIGPKIAQNLTNTAWEIVKAGITDPVIFELVGLIEEKIGADRISDMTIWIIRLNLLTYSERVAKNLKLNTYTYENCGQEFLLPAVSESNNPTILIPREILRHLPVAHDWDDIDYVCAHNEELRNRINEIIGSTWNYVIKKYSKRDLKSILLNHPAVLRDMIAQYKSKPAEQYDFKKDPSGQIIWYDIAQEYAKQFPLSLSVENEITPENILQIVLKICNHFKSLVESNGLAVTFWNDSDKLRNERFAQLLFFGIADAYCHANNLDLNRESNAGRGPIDFKISRGYNARVNLEVKYTSNNIRSGYEKQLPIYNSAERTHHSIFLVIITTDSIKSLEDLIKFRESQVSNGKRAPEIVVVDGRIRPSASKVK